MTETNKHHPGILERIGHLIILQPIFILGAVVLLFWPSRDRGESVDSLDEVRASVHQLVTTADSLVHVHDGPGSNCTTESAQLSDLFEATPLVGYAELNHVDPDGRIANCVTYIRKGTSDGIPVEEFSSLVDSTRLVEVANEPSRASLQSSLTPHVWVTYFPLKASHENCKTILTLAVDRGGVGAQTAGTVYSLVALFLGTILVTFLTIYLMKQRFRRPLDRLIRGIEKTSQGEVFYQMEAEGDRELEKLAHALNEMTKTLWTNQRQLKMYNQRLKQTNLSLLESQIFLSTLIDSSPLGIIVANPEGQIMLFNRSASSLFDYETSEVIGGKVSDLFVEQKDAVETVDEMADGVVGMEVICRRKDRSHFPAYAVVSPTKSGEGTVQANLYIIRDISESRSFQDMMIRLDRLYTRGEMAGDIAHEINNYLAVLLGNIELMPLLLKKGKMEKIDQKLDVMKTTVERIARFANGLMDTPGDEAQLEQASLNQLVDNMIAFLKPQNKFDNVEFEVSLSEELPLIMVDTGQVQQVLVNLIYNAADAVSQNESSRKIWVITDYIENNGERWAKVQVKDDGPGVDPEREGGLFAERFTTKRKGHGIGLVTCKRLIENHGGRISYKTDGGAVFTIELPFDRQPEAVESSKETEAATPA